MLNLYASKCKIPVSERLAVTVISLKRRGLVSVYEFKYYGVMISKDGSKNNKVMQGRIGGALKVLVNGNI